ncbi:MAG: L,D-transpeptidase family protein [Anaerobacillus sp.]|uniref:L,D-transpeptidase family protein n=1 Tax=Anaerobacillus sp. TaxID=1872506 RepID=UPI00391A7601
MKRLLIYSFILCFFFSFLIPASTSAQGGQFIIINKASNELAYYENNQLNRIFQVATGKSPTLTPEGNFKIVNKIVNRPYYKDNIPGGDPTNPLGPRWLGLNARGTWGTTYAIHGNSNSASIGNYVSKGCIRMHNDEVIWLFDIVAENTQVIITTSTSSFDAIAKTYGNEIIETTMGSAPTIGRHTVLQLGSHGEQVIDLQNALAILGYSPGDSGSFDEATELAVLTFQHEHGLTVDGLVGAQTIKTLRNPPSKLVNTTTPPPKKQPNLPPSEQENLTIPETIINEKTALEIQTNFKRLGHYLGEYDAIWGYSRLLK